MAHCYFNSHSLGNGLKEIEFFSKDIDYDKELYESLLNEKDNHEYEDSRSLIPDNKPLTHKDFVKIWELGGPIHVLPLPDFDVYPLYFTNFQKLDYYELKELLGNFFTLCEYENFKIRVTYKTEDDLRVGYQELKKDERYNLQVFVDVGDFYQKKNSCKKNNADLPRNKIGQRLINRWINNGDVVIETSKNNCYPIQIKNYKQFNYDELLELFSVYGKFTSIAHLENECVQVKFCDEEAARKCFTDLKKDKLYNVRLLFFLKELNRDRKLVKDIVSSKLDEHLKQLLNAEEKIKFDPNQVSGKRHSSRLNQKNKKQEQQKTETTQIGGEVIYYKKNFEHGNIYVKGTPLENPFIRPPYSYKVWKNKQNHLPAPPPEESDTMNKDVNYEYYLKNMKLLCNHSHSSCCDGAR